MRGTLDQSLCSLGCDTMISPTWTMFLPLRLEWAWRMKKGEGRDHDCQPQTIWNMRGDAPKKSVTDYEEKWAKLWDIQKQWQNSIIINKNKKQNPEKPLKGCMHVKNKVFVFVLFCFFKEHTGYSKTGMEEKGILFLKGLQILHKMKHTPPIEKLSKNARWTIAKILLNAQ